MDKGTGISDSTYVYKERKLYIRMMLWSCMHEGPLSCHLMYVVTYHWLEMTCVGVVVPLTSFYDVAMQGVLT